MKAFFLLFILLVSFGHVVAQTANWTAFNDSVNKNGGTTDETVTTINIGRSSPGPLSSELLVFGTGDGTGVTASYEETKTVGSVFWTNDSITYDADSDAAKLFGEALDLSGNISYGDAPGWHMDLILEGLDPKSRYVFAGTAMRGGGDSYAERTTNWKIIGAESFVYASSEGAWKVSDESVEFSTGHNEVGYVAKWTDIAPGEDGIIVIRTSHSVGEANGGLAGAHAYKGYAGGAFMLELQGRSETAMPKNELKILRVYPKEDEPEAYPNSPLQVLVEHNLNKVDLNSVKLLLDGKKVLPEIQQEEDVTLISYRNKNSFEDFSVHSVYVEFTDDGPSNNTYNKTWDFTIKEWSQYDYLPADKAIKLDDLEKQQKGFAIRLAATDPLDLEKEIISEIEDLWWIWDEDYNDYSDRGLFNSEGYYLERNQINYQRDQGSIGNKAGDQFFPGINGTESLIHKDEESPVIQFGMEATTYLDLKKGYYHMQITTTPIHLLFIGFGDDAVELLPDESVQPGIEDSRAWQYNFIVEKSGLYPFTLLYYDSLEGSSSLTVSGGSASSLEWLNVTPTGMRVLINGDRDDSISAYIPPNAISEVKPAKMSITMQDGKAIISWAESGILQESENVNGPWRDLNSKSSPYSIIPNKNSMLYRVRH